MARETVRRLKRLRIWPTGRLRVGEPGLGEEAVARWVPAQTVFSALCHAIVAVWGEDRLAQWLDQYREGRVPLRLSSAFPSCQGVDFLPRPLLPAPGFDDGTSGAQWSKELKKTVLIPESMFIDWIQGRLVDYSLLQQGRNLLQQAFTEQTLHRVALDRCGHRSALYYTSVLVVNPAARAGFHMWVQADDETWTMLIPALCWLGETGLGGKRSLGMGWFTFTLEEPCDTWRLLMTRPGQAYCTLSPFTPYPHELPAILEGASYVLHHRSGWAMSGGWSGRIKRYRVFGEGSVFPVRPEGRLLDVTPRGAPHPIYRYAIALSVGTMVRPGRNGTTAYTRGRERAL